MQILASREYISGLNYRYPLGARAAITHCSENIFVRGHQRPPHTHAGFEFIYLCRGSATRFVEGPRISQKVGDLFITLPGEQHGVDCKPSEEGRQIHIGLLLERIGTPGSQLAGYIRRHRLRLIRNCHALEPLLQAIVTQALTSLPHRTAVVRSYLQTLCLVIRQLADADRGVTSQELKMDAPYSPTVQKALIYMRTHLDRRLPLKDIARASAAVNASRFCTRFQQEVKMSPSAYHLNLRLEAARRALLQPTTHAISVPTDYGFSSSQHFCTAFRRAFGVTPQAWRRSAAKKK